MTQSKVFPALQAFQPLPATARIYPFSWLLLLVALLVLPPLYAQVATGDILGAVSDTTGAAIPNASVRIENTGTHALRSTQSGGDGSYTFTLLQPGTYKVTVSMAGFKSFVNPGLVLAAGDRARVDAPLQIGEMNQTVEVTAEPSALQTDSTNVGSSIEARAISDLPLNGRNVFGLVQVAPGVNAGSPNSLTSGTRPDDRRQSSSVSANGQYELLNNNLLDGLDNNERYKGLILVRPSVEAIQQVRVDTNTYTAEVGRTAGAAVTILTKSGTNQFHGSLYEFLRNDVTDARNFFARTSTLPHKPELRQNQFGGSIGGPIFHNRTFFFADLEEFRQVDATGTVYTSTVPTLYEEQHPGDLSDVGGPIVSVIEPTALGYFKLFPAPNQAGTGFTPGVSVPRNNFLYDPARVQNSTLGDLRIDQHFGQNDVLFGRYSYNKVTTYVPGQLPAVNNVQAGGTAFGLFPGNSAITVHNGQLNYSHIFSPHLLLELRVGYTLFLNNVTPLNFGSNLNQNAAYSIPNANSCLDCSGLAPITPGPGYAALGDAAFLPILLTEGNYQYAGDFTFTHGSHTIKAGGALIRRQVSNLQQNFGKPIISFSGATPQVGLSHFFAGAPFTYQRQGLTLRPHDSTWEPSVYIQDDWRARSNLTFNLGLRYDTFTAPREKNGYNSDLNLGTGNLVISPTGGIKTDHANLAPRFGFADTLRPNLVVRGGFGLSFYASDIQNAFVLLNPPYSFATETVASTAPVSAGVVAVPTPSITNLSGSVAAKPFNFKDAYVEQFNLLVQQDLHGNVITVGYVGELGRHLAAQIPNLQNPRPSGSATIPSQVYSAELPNVNTIQYFGDFASSSYNSLQTSFERRLSHGLTLNANYTLAHALDDTNNQSTNGEAAYGLQPTQISTYDYGNSLLDIRNRIAVTADYAIPFHGSGRLMRAALGDWQVNALSFWQTGAPISISSGVTQNGRAYINLPAVTTDRPDRIASPYLSNPGLTTPYFNIAAFARQPLGAAGNAGRNFIHGPHQRRTDLSLFKTFPIRNEVSAQFRAEVFNLSNTPNFAQPSGQIASYSSTPDAKGRYEATTAGNFGIITATSPGSAARQFQFAVKIIF